MNKLLLSLVIGNHSATSGELLGKLTKLGSYTHETNILNCLHRTATMGKIREFNCFSLNT